MSLAPNDPATLKQQVLGKRNRTRKSRNDPKSAAVAAYTGVFLLVMSMVAIGYQPPQKANSLANAANPLATSESTTSGQPSVDEIVATNVAADIASRANLPVAANIANQSISLSVQSQLSQDDSGTIVKPQIVELSADSRTIQQYTTKTGDTVASIAQEFGVTADTVKWANNLSADTVEPGKELKILPIDGILYTVKDGDTIESIATKFNTTVENITVFNDLELSGLVNGKQIVLPSGVLPTTERPGYVAPTTYRAAATPNVSASYQYASGFAGGSSLGAWGNTKRTSPGNTNAWGNCTWWAWERRLELGRPLPSGAMGNAAEWSYTMARAGLIVNKTPAFGALIQNGGGYGHVGVVEVVNSDGSIVISEMNNYSAGGFNIINKRVIPAYAVANFNYIH